MSDSQKKDEFELIEVIKSTVSTHDSKVIVGVGDDAAVCAPSEIPLLICNDAMVENRHFKLKWMTPHDLGHKALASTLSDIAAMNGKPLYSVIALGLTPNLGSEFVKEFYEGAQSLAKSVGIRIVGGDLVKTTSEVFVDVTCVGQTAHPVLRSGAQPGDLVFVTGFPGLAAAGLIALEAGLTDFVSACTAHLRPQPRFDVLKFINAPGLLSAMIDISDGLSSELYHLAQSSRCGFHIGERLIQLHPELQRLGMKQKLNPYDLVWGGGEDYELLFTASKARLEERPDLKAEILKISTQIGFVTDESQGIRVTRTDGKIETLANSGWNHFSSATR